MLTAKQKAFCTEYLVDLNATQAARRAGYSKKTADVQGYQLLHKTSVADRIAELKAKRQERTTVTADDVVNGLLENHKAARDVGKYSDSNKALELLGKHLGLFTDKHEISSPGGKPIDKEWTVRFVSPGDKLD
jgi:phage terminase small subunit